MTKLNILRLDSTTENDTAATLNINTNFENIQKAIENTLSRDGTAPNYMDADLDMNSYRIINVGTAVDDTDVVGYKQFKDEIGEATVAAASSAASAAQAATSAQSALVSATNAISAVRNAENTLELTNNLFTETQEYVDAARADIDATVLAGKTEINTTIDEAQMSLSDTITQAVEDVKAEAVAAAEGAIQGAADTAIQIATDHTNTVIKPELQTYVDSSNANATVADNAATVSRTWATGTDEEVQVIEDNEHSSRTYANFAMALANADEDVPVLESTLLATDVIPVPVVDLEGYVKNTDYATTVKGGVFTASGGYGTGVSTTSGNLYCRISTLDEYNTRVESYFISKGTLENIKDDYVKRGITENTIELTDDEKANAKAWLGYADNNDIAQAIASISQFKISIVDALPTTGEAKTLYLVSKEGTDNDVYNEYLWLEQDSKFEFLGTTAVDLTEYVKNTDYATTTKGGVFIPSSAYGISVSSGGYLSGVTQPLSAYDTRGNGLFICKGTLENVLTQYSKTVSITQTDYDALETKDANTLYLIEEE